MSSSGDGIGDGVAVHDGAATGVIPSSAQHTAARTRVTRRPLIAAATCLLILLSATACGNKGGATTCLDFLQMTPDERVPVVQKMIDKDGNRGDKPEFGHKLADDWTMAISMYCNLEGTADTKISEWH